jgi:hypothetical protein
VEAQNRTLFFRGPINYSLAGTYICEATNPIGTRSGQVEVNITGRKQGLPQPLATLRFLHYLHPSPLDCVILGSFCLLFLPFWFSLKLWPLVFLFSALFKGVWDSQGDSQPERGKREEEVLGARMLFMGIEPAQGSASRRCTPWHAGWEGQVCTWISSLPTSAPAVEEICRAVG